MTEVVVVLSRLAPVFLLELNMFERKVKSAYTPHLAQFGLSPVSHTERNRFVDAVLVVAIQADL